MVRQPEFSLKPKCPCNLLKSLRCWHWGGKPKEERGLTGKHNRTLRRQTTKKAIQITNICFCSPLVRNADLHGNEHLLGTIFSFMVCPIFESQYINRLPWSLCALLQSPYSFSPYTLSSWPLTQKIYFGLSNLIFIYMLLSHKQYIVSFPSESCEPCLEK
jgi:hypothetical protein